MDQLIREKNTKNSGQVALVMVLIMTVVSAVVVSVAGRVTTETRIQQLSKDSSDAFLAAQSGLEEAVSRQESLNTTTIDTDRSYKVTLENKGQEGLLTDRISSGTSIDIVLNASPSLQGIRVYWKSVTSSPSALFVSKITDDDIEDFAYDTTGENGFTLVSEGGTLNGVEFTHATNPIDLTVDVKRLRVSLYGGAAILGFQPIGDVLPVQVVSYKSEGVVGTGADTVRYGLNYEESRDKRTPEVFDYALFSYGSIIQ